MVENPIEQNEPQPTQAPVSLTARQAETLLKADLANLAKKVQAGKMLSAHERNMLQSAIAGGVISNQEYAHTQDELAKLLGVTRKTIQRWRKLKDRPEDKADGRMHVPSWRIFKAQRQGEDETESEEQSPAHAKARQILLQNERLEMRILAEKGELVPKEIANQVFAKLLIAAKTRCFTSVTRFVTLARMAEDSNKAAEEIRKEMILIWQELEKGEWLK